MIQIELKKLVSKLLFSFFVKRLVTEITGLKEASSLKKCAPVGDWIPGTCYVDFIYNYIVILVSKLKDQLFLRKKVGMSCSNSFSSTHSKASTSMPLEIENEQYESEI